MYLGYVATPPPVHSQLIGLGVLWRRVNPLVFVCLVVSLRGVSEIVGIIECLSVQTSESEVGGVGACVHLNVFVDVQQMRQVSGEGGHATATAKATATTIATTAQTAQTTQKRGCGLLSVQG